MMRCCEVKLPGLTTLFAIILSGMHHVNVTRWSLIRPATDESCSAAVSVFDQHQYGDKLLLSALPYGICACGSAVSKC